MKRSGFFGPGLFLLLFFFFLLPPLDPDLGWQLRCGQEFWQNHSFCQQNQFSVLLEGYFWPNHHWFYQALVFPLYNFLGLWGLTLANALLLGATFFLFTKTFQDFLLEKLLAIVTIVGLGWGVFLLGLRSQLLGFFFLSVLLWLATEVSLKPKLALLYPLVMLAWVQCHGSFVLGLILLFFLLTKEVVKEPKKWFLASGLYLLCLIATLINPSGFGLYQEAWRHLFGYDLSKLIAEWRPPSPIIALIMITTSLGLGFLLVKSQAREKRLGFFLLLPFLILALKAQRNVTFYFLVWFFLFFDLGKDHNPLLERFTQKPWRQNLTFFLVLGLLAYSLIFQFPKTLKTNLNWTNFCQSSYVGYPCQAIDYLKKQPKGNLFNAYEWGGLLIWQLPQDKVFVDGRMPAWPTKENKSPYTIYLETLQTQPGWQETLAQYHIRWLLIGPGTFLDLLLKKEPEKFGFREAYRDKISVVYQKI